MMVQIVLINLSKVYAINNKIILNLKIILFNNMLNFHFYVWNLKIKFLCVSKI